MNNIEELKAKKPEDLKSRSSVLADYVTDDNTGGYFVVECENCGEVFPSQKLGGGGAIADTGDYDDAYCPHCNAVDPDECYNAGLVWNIQQAKINALIAQLEAAQKERDELRDKFNEMSLQKQFWVKCAKELESQLEKTEAALSVANEKLQVPAGYCIMPESLTAENGAKGALSGKFFTVTEITCEECGGDYDEGDPCENCNGFGVKKVRTAIGWSTIKDIYKMAVGATAIRPVGLSVEGE
ncbi:hypothetical protein [Yersinia mollaretii]|uniref:hypothetical protein n=1 Tax=Yersinia mollaretii TaxID=33060 RepID=UPI001ABEECBF|nr:hypothetical protein [Yersinia mollaretii]